MIKVKYRIKKHDDFQKVIHLRCIYKNEMYIVYVKNNDLQNARIGISVSKKIGNAVVRNLIKRQIRAMAKNLVDLRTPRDLVIIVRKDYDRTNFSKSESELRILLGKIK